MTSMPHPGERSEPKSHGVPGATIEPCADGESAPITERPSGAAADSVVDSAVDLAGLARFAAESSAPFVLLPAVDITEGRAVRLTRGKVDGPGYASPEDVVREFAAAGARWVHLVDLDRARGVGENDLSLARAIEVAREAGLHVQASGGLATSADVRRVTAAGAERVNLACETLRDREHLRSLLGQFGEVLSVSVDARAGQLIARGSNAHCGRLDEALEWLRSAGAGRVVATDIDADGAMTGPNLTLIDVAAEAGFDVVASGGIATLDDLIALARRRRRGVTGAVVGKALHLGRFTVAEAMAATRA